VTTRRPARNPRVPARSAKSLRGLHEAIAELNEKAIKIMTTSKRSVGGEVQTIEDDAPIEPAVLAVQTEITSLEAQNHGATCLASPSRPPPKYRA
jgi:hypothetical protein